MSRCRSCGAEIIWVKMQSGKKMPCDPPLLPFWWSPKGEHTLITQDGETVTGDLDGEPDEVTDVGRISHWATCPHADNHRRKQT